MRLRLRGENAVCYGNAIEAGDVGDGPAPYSACL
jgi:hypothetical protein